MEELKFGVVIVTYNRLHLLKECLRCVALQKLHFHSIVIVDNCSNDGTKEYLKELDTKKMNCNTLEVINLDKNLGGAGGFSLGVQRICNDVDYLLLIDDDAMIHKDFLSSINNGMTPQILAYSGIVETDGKIDTTHRRRVSNWRFMKKEDVPKEEYSLPFFDYDLSSFCGLCFKTSLINKIGFPKYEYFIWYDDTKYSLRIFKFTKIRNINTAKINHKTIITNEARLNWKSFYGYRNMIDTGKNHSTSPFLFCTMRYSYHLIRYIQYLTKGLIEINESARRYYLTVSKLHLRVITESISGRLGVDNVFKPGLKF